MTSFLYMSTKYHGLEYFVSKHVLVDLCKKYHDIPWLCHNIQILCSQRGPTYLQRHGNGQHTYQKTPNNYMEISPKQNSKSKKMLQA
jgi:hypothetical protein